MKTIALSFRYLWAKPLAAALNLLLLSLGLGGPVTAEQADFLERIRKSQQHLLGIISDLLNFSRMTLSSKVGEGSTFTLTLPRAP